MANTLSFGGSVNNTSGFTSYSGNFFYTDGYGMPSGNLSLTGTAPIKVYSTSVAYHSGATYTAINYQGSGNVGSGSWASSGGTFRFAVGHGSGTMYVGRNTGNGLTMVDSADGGVLTGGIVGSLTYAFVTTAPASITPVRTGRDVAVTVTAPSSDGGAAVSTYGYQYSTNGGSSWSTAVNDASLTHTFTSLTAGVTYTFRAYANNDVGSSAATVSSTVFIPAGGRRWDGAAEVATATAVRWDGAAEVALATAVRWDGAAEVALS